MATPLLGMRNEFTRLGTFNGFEVPVGVWTLQLAQAGFCRNSTCGDHELVCFSCGLKVDVRTLSRQPVKEVHKRLSPSCSFVTGASNNQPVQSVDSATASGWLGQSYSLAQPDAAAPKLPGPISYPQIYQALDLVFSEGIQHGTQDTIPFEPDMLEPSVLPSLPSGFLTSFQGTVIDSEPTTLPDEIAESQSRSDSDTGIGFVVEPLMTDGEALPMEGTFAVGFSQPDAQAYAAEVATSQPKAPEKKTVTFNDLGIVVQRPKCPDNATVAKRLSTFDSWRGLGEFQTKEILAEAGFYYAGYADCCRCFYCGGGLKNWEVDDHPWIEHGRWFKTCPYVLITKGQDFIGAVESLDRTNTKITMTDVEREIVRIKALTYASPVSQPMRQDSALDLDSEGVPEVDNLDMGKEKLMNDAELQNQQKKCQELTVENEALKQPIMCKICLDSEVSILFVPCGHLVSCAVCAPGIHNCPVCRHNIKGQVRIQYD